MELLWKTMGYILWTSMENYGYLLWTSMENYGILIMDFHGKLWNTYYGIPWKTIEYILTMEQYYP